MPNSAPTVRAVVVGLACVGALAGCRQPHIHAADPATNPATVAPGAGGAPSLPPAPLIDADIALGDAGAGSGPPAPPPPSAGGVVVYAHSGSDLFRVDPQTLEITRVGPFLVKAGARDKFLNTITDIAIDKAGQMTGITFDQLLSINSATAECKPIAPLVGTQLNGLSWIRTDDGGEILAATGVDGTMLRIDPVTGAAKPIGNFGKGQKSSGDLVSVATYGTLVTLQGPDSDLLARVDPTTGAATVIGPTNFDKVWGIGFWGNRVFGFTQIGEFILIDPKTGAGTLVRTERAYPFWGAGVSTSVPVID